MPTHLCGHFSHGFNNFNNHDPQGNYHKSYKQNMWLLVPQRFLVLEKQSCKSKVGLIWMQTNQATEMFPHIVALAVQLSNTTHLHVRDKTANQNHHFNMQIAFLPRLFKTCWWRLKPALGGYALSIVRVGISALFGWTFYGTSGLFKPAVRLMILVLNWPSDKELVI